MTTRARSGLSGLDAAFADSADAARVAAMADRAASVRARLQDMRRPAPVTSRRHRRQRRRLPSVGAVALASVGMTLSVGGMAAADALPDQWQHAVASVAGEVGVRLPDPESPPPAPPAPPAPKAEAPPAPKASKAEAPKVRAQPVAHEKPEVAVEKARPARPEHPVKPEKPAPAPRGLQSNGNPHQN